MTENTAKYAGGGYMRTSYQEIIHPKPEETRTGEEIKEHFKKKLAKFGGEPG